MSINSRSDYWPGIALGSIVLAALAIMSVFNVPLRIAIDSLPSAIIWIFATVASLYNGIFIVLSPALVGSLVKVMQPILNYWAGTDGDGVIRFDPPWYGETGWQIALAIGITITGYAIIFWKKGRY